MNAQSDVIAPLLDAVAAAAGHAAGIVRFVDQVEGESARPLGAHDRTAVALVVSAVSVLAEQAGIRSDDLPGRAGSFGVTDPGRRRDEDAEVVPSDPGDGHPSPASADSGGDVVLDGPNVRRGDHEGISVDHELVIGHDASPSAGESADRGDASTLSVGGERAAGALSQEAPAAAPVDGPMSTNPSLTVLHASAGLLRELTELLDSEQVRDLVARTRAHLDAAHGIDPDWWMSPTSKDLVEACHDLEDALAVIDYRRREQERAALADSTQS